MEDVLHAHAARVAASNQRLTEAAKALRETADAAARVAVAQFGERILGAVKAAEAARIDLDAALEAATGEAQAALAAAFDANLADIAISNAAAQAELDARAAFVATGRLPTGNALPRTDAAPDIVLVPNLTREDVATPMAAE